MNDDQVEGSDELPEAVRREGPDKKMSASRRLRDPERPRMDRLTPRYSAQETSGPDSGKSSEPTRISIGNVFNNHNSQIGIQTLKGKAENFTQQADHRQISVDLTALAAELDILRREMAQEAATAADSQAVAEIHAAAEAASVSDEPSIRRHLAKAGQWALEVAERIGTELAAAVLKRALGIGD